MKFRTLKRSKPSETVQDAVPERSDHGWRRLFSNFLHAPWSLQCTWRPKEWRQAFQNYRQRWNASRGCFGSKRKSQDNKENRRCFCRKRKSQDNAFASVLLGRSLGSGANGTVYMADLKGRPVAVKIVNTSLAKAVRVPEMAISKIRHRNVLDIMAVKHNVDQQRISGREGSGLSLCWDSFSSGSFSELAKGIPSKNGGTYYPTQETWILMEYCDLGSLFEAIREKRFHRDGVMETPAMEMILCVAAQVADAMACLHRSGIVHGDLKTQNIFLKTAKDTPLGFVAKVGDFGTSRMLKKNDMMHTNLWGTVDHMAPEVLKDGEVRTAMDVFSFGMILLEFLTAQRPFAGKNSASILMSIVEGMRPEIPSYIPRPYAELIQDCWNQDWKKRPSFRQLHRRILSLMQQMRQWDRQSRDKRKFRQEE